jgi:hypothetical protein
MPGTVGAKSLIGELKRQRAISHVAGRLATAGRRLQVQPTRRGPGRHGSDAVSRARANELLGKSYVNDLRNVVDMEVTRAAGVELGVDPLGGAAQRIVDNALF